MFNMSLVGKDRKNGIKVVNQGIDSRLEGFTRSRFSDDGRRMECDVSEEELQIFVRRLLELDKEEAGMLADDICQVAFSAEDEVLESR